MSRPPLQNHKYIIYYKFEWLRCVGGHHHVLHPTFLFCAHAHPCVCCVLRVICFFSYFCAYEITFFGRLFPSSYHLSLHTTMHSLHPLSRLLISMCVIWLSCISQTPSCGTNFPVAYRLSQAEHEKSTLGLAEVGTCVARRTEGIFVGGWQW